jgi:hypothetical protein
LESKPGFKKETVFAALIVAVWLCVTLIVLGQFGIKDGWPAFIVLLFFFETGANPANLKNIFAGGAVGLLLAWGLHPLAGALVPALGPELGVLLAVGIIVFLLIALGDISHMLFNNYAFMYFTIAMIYPVQATVTWLGVLFLGGAFFVGGILLVIKLLESAKAKGEQAA